MADFTGDDVNAVLKLVAELAPGVDGKAGDTQLSILATALCIAARDCGVDREHFVGHLANTYHDVLTRELTPLYGSN